LPSAVMEVVCNNPSGH